MINWDETGTRIKELRNARKLSLRTLAAELGVSHTAVADWEKGKSQPNKENVNALANVFNVKPSFILTGEQIKDSAGQKLVNLIDLLSKEDRILLEALARRLLITKTEGQGADEV